ncbi:hypothetical protein CSUI_005509 [Cystoisospora suis]|uniref:Uncharacterized protein n=1 Tax=Cystoisospora suis TaxID=483139 RepID=A0A2C6KWT7_9APIC|nr:hypothetical protein CSUI_005509 [Cystoisospora suis]
MNGGLCHFFVFLFLRATSQRTPFFLSFLLGKGSFHLSLLLPVILFRNLHERKTFACIENSNIRERKRKRGTSVSTD